MNQLHCLLLDHHKKLGLIKSLIHYCGINELGIYSSASQQIPALVDELQQEIKNAQTQLKN